MPQNLLSNEIVGEESYWATLMIDSVANSCKDIYGTADETPQKYIDILVGLDAYLGGVLAGTAGVPRGVPGITITRDEFLSELEEVYGEFARYKGDYDESDN